MFYLFMVSHSEMIHSYEELIQAERKYEIIMYLDKFPEKLVRTNY